MEALNERRVEEIANAVAFAFFAGDPSPEDAARTIIAADPGTPLLGLAEKVLLDLFASEGMALEIPDPDRGSPHWNAARALLRDLREGKRS